MGKDQIDRFKAELERVKGEFLLSAGAAALRSDVVAWLQRQGCRRIGVSRHPIVRDALEGASFEIHRLRGDGVDAVVTGADCLIAETGTIALAASEDCPRTLLFLPPIHVVLATEDQIVPDLAASLETIKKRGWAFPALTLVTGPSRTADIEKVLVMGAHGPKRLAVFIVSPGGARSERGLA